MPRPPSPEARERFDRLAETPLRSIGATVGSRPRDIITPVREIFRQREMLDLLVRRDLKARYKDSTLGFFWSLARPLLQLAIYFVVVGQFLGAARGIPDFAVYIFAGLTAMGLFTDIVVGGTSSILANTGLVKKVYVPREVFPLASVGSAIFNFVIQLVVLLLATFLVGRPPLHAQLLYFVPALLVIVIWGTALALLFAALNVYLRDVQYLVEVGTMLLFWATPVLYSWQMVRELVHTDWIVELYTANPLTLAVIGFQHAFWVAGDDVLQPSHMLLRLLAAIVVGLIALFFCHRAFLRLQGNFAQEL
ncbi:MAG: ABC transporter permease [Microbacterium sp.]|uniref:ABC transporter permease n=1 Tax=Microbacterium sp. TaxID=51671 RepID=UPI0039E4010B